MKSLKISKDLKLPISTVTQKLAWLGTTGSGKTYGASKLAEEFWAIGAQFVVIDPVGVWYGLRLAKDGKKPSSINIPIFGGLHGDVPLESTGGELLANLVVDKGLSCIIDVSQFESETEKARFAMDFANKLFFRKKSKPSAIHLFLEECQEFVPQNPQKGEERMLHAFVRMQKLGRNFGIGSSYISQRPQEVNKKALNMCQTLFVFRTTGTHERTAIEKWIEDKSLDETIANDLPKIPTGDCHVWSPEFLKISEMAHISEKETFNASATPEVGAVAKARHLAPIDLDKVRSEMAATIEKAKGEDPKLLRQKIIQLERELKRPQPNQSSQMTKMVPMGVSQWLEYGKKYAYDKFFLEKAKKEKEAMEKYIAQLLKALAEMCTEGDRALRIKRIVVEKSPGYVEPRQVYNAPVVLLPQGKRQHTPLPVEKTQFDSGPTHNEEDEKKMGAGERTVLIAVAQNADGMTRNNITVHTLYKRSTRDAYIARLAQRGYVVTIGTKIKTTESGIEALGNDYEPLPQGPDLVKYLEKRLPNGEWEILNLLLNNPAGLERESITEMLNFKRSTRDAYIARLSARELIESDAGLIKAVGILLF